MPETMPEIPDNDDMDDVPMKKERTDIKLATIYYWVKSHIKEVKELNMTKSQFCHLMRRINETLAEALEMGQTISLPLNMGTITPRKKKLRVFYSDEGVLINTYATDWEMTKKIWDEDEEARKERIRIKKNGSFTGTTVRYTVGRSAFTNSKFIEFRVYRRICRKLYNNVINGITDCLQ